MSPLSKVVFSAKVEEISETDIDEWHETPDVNAQLILKYLKHMFQVTTKMIWGGQR